MSTSLGEMNRSEAERCIEIAQVARRTGDLSKAERFLSKSISMFETSHATRLLSEVQTEIKMQTTSQSKDGKTTTSTTYESTTTQSTSKAASVPLPTKHEPQFTPEQRADAQKVVKQTNYYEILGLPLPSSSNEIDETKIKSAYRKMALKFHPDKNHAPEAEEAFKKVSAAFQCLSDPTKRRIYDQSGYSEPQAGGGGGGGMRGFNGFGGGGGGGHYHREADFSPEDIFNMFFGMNAQFNQMQGRRVFTQRMPRRQPQQQQQQQQHQEGGFQFMSLIHLLPLLLLFVFSFLSAPSGQPEQPFSLSQTRQYSYQHTTPTHNLPFWVDSSLYTRINRDAHIGKQIYGAVEQEYLKRWRAGCEAENKEREKLSKAAMYAKSRGEGSAEHLKAVQRLTKFESKNCDKVNDFYSKPKR